MKHGERHLTNYCGFKVILPANMLDIKPYLYLEHKGRYYVEIGDTDKGVIVRLYHCLEGLKDKLANLEDELADIKRRAKAIDDELSKDINYADRIIELQEKLNEIDKKLGVTK